MPRKILLGSALGLSLGIGTANAGTLSINFDNSNALSPPGHLVGYLNATFADVSGGVELTLTSHITSGNFLTDLFFNFNPTKNDPTSRFFTVDNVLSFALESATGGFRTNAPVITSNNGLNVAGGSLIDIWLRDFTGPLHNGDQAKYLITGTLPLPDQYGYELGLGLYGGIKHYQISAADFNFLTECENPFPCFGCVGYEALAQFYGGFYGATSGRLNPTITPLAVVSEPASMLILGAGMLGLVGLRNRKIIGN